MRLVFLLTFIGLAPTAWPELVSPAQAIEAYYGVAVSFWAALALLAVIGMIFPVQMLPLLLLQFLYKLIWLLTVGLPLWQQGLLSDAATDLAIANTIGVVLDTLVIPWGYLVKQHWRLNNVPSTVMR